MDNFVIFFHFTPLVLAMAASWEIPLNSIKLLYQTLMENLPCGAVLAGAASCAQQTLGGHGDPS